MVDSFTHLHLHTEFSMLDGAARVTDVINAAVADGQKAIGITDHGNMYGVLDFYKAARAASIKPIIGTEAYMAAESRFERPARRGRVDDGGGDAAEGEKLYYHLTLLAETTAGYRNLMKLSSAAYLEGYYYKPRADWELLARHHEGVIATTGCLGGLVLQSLLRGDFEAACGHAARLQDIFGRESLFVELQDHGLEKQRKTNPQLIDIARRIGAPLLATNDSHYTHRDDAVAHDALLCVQTGSTMDDPNRFKFDGSEHYLKSAAEMRSLFAEVPEACDNTLLIAERADVEIEFGKPKLPSFPRPPGFADADAYLRHLTMEGAEVRYGAPIPDNVMERLDFELGVISRMGFSDYFLVVWDLIHHARSRGIRVGPGRGSAAGCCVAYCLRIVDLDPIRYDLLFERFLNPGRQSMPDIDMDFDERYRGEMIRYATERYGWDRVAQIVTFSTIKARAAVRDAARVLGLPYSVGDRIAKAMPPLVMGRDTPLGACLEVVAGHEDGYHAAIELRDMYAVDPDAKKVIDVARGLEGMRRQDGIHAAAVVISADPLTEYLPIQRKPEPGGRAEDSPIVTQYEMHGVEELGLLKMDFLGLRNLSVMERALDLIEANTGTRPDIDGVALDDPAVFEMLRRADSIGVFQLEGAPMRALTRALAPTSFDDICALIALYRPGPMAANMHYDYADRKNGRKPITYLHPDMAEVLGETQGLMIYQESMMRVAQRFAGYSLEEADNLRKAAGKKNRVIMAMEREKFVAGCVATGYGAELGSALFDVIEPFADYAFNKSHSYGYGLVSYQTAWLKANHPVEYLAALLTSVKDDKDKTAVYLSECRSRGIEVLVPDINLSVAEFTAVRGGGSEGAGAIPFGLAAVRNVGEGLVERIVAARERGRPVPRLLRLLRAGRPGGAQQADHRVAHQGRRLRLPRPSPPGAVPGGRADRRAHPGPAPGARAGGHEPVRRLLGPARRPDGRLAGVRRHPGPDPRHRVRQAPAAGLREGDARAVRERPPADRGGGGPAPPRRRHRPGAAGARRGRAALGRRGHHRAQPQVHQAGRADGDVHPGGPGGGRRRVGVPPHHDRHRLPPGRRRRGVRPGPPRPAGGRAQADLHGAAPPRAGGRRERAASPGAALARPLRRAGAAPQAAAGRPPGPGAGVPPRGHQDHPAGGGVQRQRPSWPAGRVAGPARAPDACLTSGVTS